MHTFKVINIPLRKIVSISQALIQCIFNIIQVQNIFSFPFFISSVTYLLCRNVLFPSTWGCFSTFSLSFCLLVKFSSSSCLSPPFYSMLLIYNLIHLYTGTVLQIFSMFLYLLRIILQARISLIFKVQFYFLKNHS